VFNTRAWHGSATMSSYWGFRCRQAGLATPSAGRHSLSPHNLDSQVINDGGHAIIAGGSGGFQPLGISSQKKKPAPLSGYPSVSSLTLYSGRSSFTSAEINEAGSHHKSSGGSAQAFSRVSLISSSRSDPAIAATGLKVDSYADMSEPLPAMRSFTFLRLGPEILQPSYHTPWMKFMWKMREGGFC
jgi:hypothetical protein